jgi:hypothetical protein
MKPKHSLIHDTFTLERRYPSAPAKDLNFSIKEPPCLSSSPVVSPSR